MSKNPFTDTQNYETKPKRNSFDLSFQNNLTLRFGDEVPVFCTELLPGDSISIDAALALKMMPFVFPVQTPIRATLHFFAVRHRNLLSDWMDFIYGNRTDVVLPYLSDVTVIKTGSLGDYLGVPTTVASTKEAQENFFFGNIFITDGLNSESVSAIAEKTRSVISSAWTSVFLHADEKELWVDSYFSGFFMSTTILGPQSKTKAVSVKGTVMPSGYYHLCLFTGDKPSGTHPFGIARSVYEKFPYTSRFISPGGAFDYTFNLTDEQYEALCIAIDEGLNPSFGLLFQGEDVGHLDAYLMDPEGSYYGSLELSEAVDAGVNILKELRVSALPFRAYESIHNGFYRDFQNDPWDIDGVPQYNNYCTTHEGGEDKTNYHLFTRNWEKDFLTSALPTPQQGLAPLVGITSTGVMQIQREDGSIAHVQAVTGDDNDTIIGFKSSADLSDSVVRATAFAAATSGISINDFRNVNSMQRWLENNIRRGLKYKDQMLANTGVAPKFDTLDMPEFLGGFSRMVNISQVTQTTETDKHPLGDYAGQGNLFGGSEHTITKYADEHMFIMGILTVVPQPAYSQLLPKMFLRQSALDYYNPVFGHIGMQPITNAEVAPLQAIFEGVDLAGVFGYQRPWYDLIAKVDEVHGEMRKSMRDFIMNRTFAVMPELGPEFLHVDPAQCNQVFSYTGADEHNIMGQLVFKVYKKTAIPRFGIPRLEA